VAGAPVRRWGEAGRLWPSLLLAFLVATAARADTPQPAIIAPLAARSLLLGVRAVPGGGLVAVGERGHVLTSADGVSWTQRPVPARSGLTALAFADSHHGWAVGNDEVIVRTEDGGATWLLAHYAPEKQQPLLDVWFADALHGLAVGAFSSLYATDDGGRNWHALEFAPKARVAPRAAAHAAKAAGAAMRDDDEGITQPHLNAVAGGASGPLYLAGEAGHLYRSTDRGQSWQELSSPYEGSFFGIVPLAGDSVLVFGLRGHLFRSDDAGEHWRALESHTQALLAGGTTLADGTVVIVGLGGTVLVSRDGGQHFALHQEADRKGFAAVAPSPGGVVIVGESGIRTLARSTLDGG